LRTISDRLAKDLDRILDRLVDSDEFADEIERMGLNPRSVAREVARDPAVRARALTEYEPVIDLQQRMTAHKQSQQRAWPDDWIPSGKDMRLLLGAGICAVTWVLFDALISDLLSASLSLALSFMLVGAWAVFLLFGLPRSVRDRCRWLIDHARLAAGLPARWWEIQQELRDEVLIPELRGWLGGRASPEFGTTLELRDARGLMMPAGQGPLVPTEAVRACMREINRGRSEAVGIAGSRGAGKSTIIDRAVRNEFTDPERNPVLGVFTTAPVRYDARDFVLHLNASVCRAVLDELASTDGAPSSDSRRLWSRRFLLYRFRKAAVAWLKSILRVGVVALVALGIVGATWGGREGDRGAEAIRGAAAAVKELKERPREILESKPLHVFAIVVIALLLLVMLWITLRRLVGPLASGLAVAIETVGERALAYGIDPAEKALRAVTRQHLRRIRFLQTRTSGWSGKLAGIGGIELVPTRSTANAEQPLTYPEVVDRLRDFLELVGEVLITKTDRISALVIAIDELDKIADPDEAHSFLNDIKGIFGVRHCVYLVSVSEDALAAFERRGMPARDAFDSAFTSMVRVDPFTLVESQRWLAYRAIGIPRPFIWLCHCLSGGLPRDLERVAITVHDLSDTCPSLEDFARAVVHTELAVKCRAYVHVARQLADQDSDIHTLLEFLFALSRKPHVGSFKGVPWVSGDGSNSASAHLRNEVSCYLTFCETLLEVFTDDVGEHLDQSDAAYGGRSSIELLADVRRMMSVNTPLAMQVLSDFRTRNGITTP
jgi:hypothetical protein